MKGGNDKPEAEAATPRTTREVRRSRDHQRSTDRLFGHRNLSLVLVEPAPVGRP
jgi:hypothetical protein